MNEVIKQLQNRRSVREFTGEKIKEEDLQTILATAQRAANSVNGQQTSLIVVRDKENCRTLRRTETYYTGWCFCICLS